jgi:hypothetical protein
LFNLLKPSYFSRACCLCLSPAGQTFRVKLDGQERLVKCPAGAAPGERIIVKVTATHPPPPPHARTMTPLTHVLHILQAPPYQVTGSEPIPSAADVAGAFAHCQFCFDLVRALPSLTAPCLSPTRPSLCPAQWRSKWRPSKSRTPCRTPKAAAAAAAVGLVGARRCAVKSKPAGAGAGARGGCRSPSRRHCPSPPPPPRPPPPPPPLPRAGRSQRPLLKRGGTLAATITWAPC